MSELSKDQTTSDRRRFLQAMGLGGTAVALVGALAQDAEGGPRPSTQTKKPGGGDVGAPTISITGPAPGSHVGSPFTAWGQCTEAGVATAMLTGGGGGTTTIDLAGPTYWQVTCTATGIGQRTLTVTTGGSPTASASESVYIDPEL